MSEARRQGAVDVLVVLVWFAVSGLLGALIWSRVVDLPQVARSGSSATVAPVELVKEVGVDAWFFVIAVVGGLVGGVALLAWRRRDPLLMVIAVTLGAGLASWLMERVGLLIGPDDAATALRNVPDGGHVPAQLTLHAPGVLWMWPFAAAFGALLQLWVLGRPDSAPRDHTDLGTEQPHEVLR